MMEAKMTLGGKWWLNTPMYFGSSNPDDLMHCIGDM
jgi:hypothetical protein